MPSLLWPWAIAVPVGFGIGLWTSAPGGAIASRASAAAGATCSRALLDGVGILHTLIRSPRTYAGAWLGIAFYWAADIAPSTAACGPSASTRAPAR